MCVREPVAAGRFYPADRQDCAAFLDELIADLPTAAAIGAIAPHAGWIYSGRTAARSILGLSERQPETILMFGAVHVPMRAESALFANGAWETPVGTLQVDADLAQRLSGVAHVQSDVEPHWYEHSIEVLLPIVGSVLPTARIVPLMVRPGPWALELGRDCARAASESGRRIAYLASTDLTHYGPAFAFEPAGRGEPGMRWAKDVNDRRLIQLVAEGRGAAVLNHAAVDRSACGAGAVAALLGAVSEARATTFRELEHTSSADVERAHGGRPTNSVGYLSAIFLEN